MFNPKIKEKLFNLYCLYYLYKMWRFDRYSTAKRESIHGRKLRKIIQCSFDNPRYALLFQEKGINQSNLDKFSLEQLPCLSKEMYRSWMEDELNNNPHIKDYKLTHTSGSTGIPTTNIFTIEEYAQHYMADFFGWVKGGYNPFLGKSLTKQAGDGKVGTDSFIQKLGLLRRKIFNTYWDRNVIVDIINSYQPDFILANSSELLYIAQYIIDNNLNIHSPRYYCPTGENIDGRVEKILKSVFGEGLINIYGGTEMADFAVKVPGDDKYEILEDMVAVCVKKDDGTIAMEGEGEILVTPLFRREFPLLNYELGDRVELKRIDGKLYITKITGRKNDVFYWRNGEQTFFMRLYDINCTLEDIFQIRFIQENQTKLVIQAVKDTRSKKSIDELESYLHQKYDDSFPADVEVVIEWCNSIKPEKNGKIRNMISKIPT